MSFRGCSSLHFISSIKDGLVEKVYNMDLRGKPSPKFKRLEEIYQHADAEYSPILAERETRETNNYDVEENEPDSVSKESSLDNLTLSQFKKKMKRKRRKASEPVLLIPKAEDDEFDLTEPLCNFRHKVSKSSRSKRVSDNENFPTVNVKVEVLEVEYFENDLKMEEPELSTNEMKSCEFSEVEFFENNHDLKIGESESFKNEGEKCEFNEVECFENNHDLKIGESELLKNEAEKCEFNEVECFENNHDLKIGESELLKNEVEKCEFNEVPDVEFFESNHDLTIDESETFKNEEEKCEFDEVLVDRADDVKNTEMNDEETITNVNQPPSVPISLANDSFLKDPTDFPQSQLYIQQTSDQQANYISGDQDSDPTIDGEDEATSNSLISQDISSEVKLDQTGEESDIRQLERLPLTRKFISPNSQEKLCQALKSSDSFDDMEHFKCKEKLFFGEQTENTVSPNKSNAELIQKKAVISSKHKKPKNYKKGCLDGPRLCRSLPRLSSGCTSIEGCSESAIAFSQRQMHDIESLATKLMSELNSMKVIVQEKMIYEAYSSTSLKTEADEVKSAIKSATKTEETAKRWLSMMSRDCNRFCKIMKLNEDNKTSASGDPALGNTNQEKPLEREKKKISFADEAGGMLCDIKVYQIEQEPSLT